MTEERIGRRSLLAGLAASATVLEACGVTPSPTTGTAPSASPSGSASAQPAAFADEWEALRAEFELSSGWIHAGGFLLASHPRRVREAIEAHRRGLDENPVHYLHANEGAEVTLAAAAAYLGVPADEIALTDSTTMGLAILYGGLVLKSGDEILATTHDHYATHESLRLAALRSGAVVKKVPLYERAAEATEAAMASAIERGISKATRVVAITWVHSSTGVKTPVKAIAEVVARANRDRAPEQNILLAVDGVHGFGVEDVAVADLGCDFFVAGCHKWLLGPRGTGVMWGRTAHVAALRPVIPSFSGASYGAWMRGEAPPPTTAAMMTPGGFHSFEHRWALGEAFAMHASIGKAKIATRIRALCRAAKEGLAAMKHVTLHTPIPDALSSGIVCFEVAGHEPSAVVKALHDARIIGTQTPYLPTYARLSFGLLNTPADVDASLAVIRALG